MIQAPDRKFFPANAGMTKLDIIDMINDQWDGSQEPWASIGEPDINKLSDERTQQFVDELFDAGEELKGALIDGFGAEERAEEMEALFKALAQEIQSD